MIGLIVASHSRPAFAGISVAFTVNLSEAVNVVTTGGTPQIAIDVGGTPRQATYTSGSGTNALTFTYTATQGDLDLDGVTLTSPLSENGGTIKDLNGNAANLAFTAPDTSNVKINYPSLSMDFTSGTTGTYSFGTATQNSFAAFLSAASGTYTRASVGTYYNSSGSLVTATSGNPRFDYDPVSHTAKGLLIEEGRTNLFTYSDDMSNWLTSPSPNDTVTTTNVVTSPDGTGNADLVVATATSGSHLKYRNFAGAANTTYTVSAYLKAGGYNWARFILGNTGFFNSGGPGGAYFDLQNGAIGTIFGGATNVKMVSVGNGWYRCSFSLTSDSDGGLYVGGFTIVNGNGVTTVTGDGVNGTYIYGAQIEAGAFPTSYIPTSAATVARAADVFTLPNGSWLDATSTSIFANFQSDSVNSAAIDRRIIGTTGSASSVDLGQLDNSSTLIKLFNGTAALSQSTSNIASGERYAASFSSTGRMLSINGANATTDANANPSFTGLSLGSVNGNASFLNGHLLSFKYYPKATIAAQVKLLSQ